MHHYKILFTVLIVSLLNFSVTYSQGRPANSTIQKSNTEIGSVIEKVKVLNTYIQYCNEGTHGMCIVQRLLDNFNKSLNKYVDLPGEPKFYFTNKDTEEDVFNTEMFRTACNAEYENIKKNKGILPAHLEGKLLADVEKIRPILTRANAIRFELETQLNTLDLNEKENLSKVYEKLEEAVKLYKDYNTYVKNIGTEVRTYYKTLNISDNDKEFPDLIKKMDNVYLTTWEALLAFYNKDDDNLETLIKNQKAAFDQIKHTDLLDYESTRLISPTIQNKFTNIKSLSDKFINLQTDFLQAAHIPDNYKMYDKYYYYYNHELLNIYNYYGPGIAAQMTMIINQLELPVLKYLDAPHYFKVVYPKKLNDNQYVVAADPVIKELPKQIRGRDVVAATHTINVDSDVVTFNLYDHKVIDGDIVSISFNGDWIVEKYKISEKPYQFTIKLNADGKNFLLLHSDDMGRQPPTTVALSYTYQGKREQIIMNSDIAKSEIIEIIKDPVK